jgi:quercetin dioxygenase-like cupin family protein
VWVVLRGRLRIRGGGTDVTVGAGEYLHVPEDSPGEVEALEDTALVCVSVPAH